MTQNELDRQDETFKRLKRPTFDDIFDIVEKEVDRKYNSGLGWYTPENLSPEDFRLTKQILHEHDWDYKDFVNDFKRKYRPNDPV